MEIKEYLSYDEKEILALYESVGWTAYTENPAALRLGFAHSLLTLAAYEGERLLGLVRTVGDGHTSCSLRIFWCIPPCSGGASAPH